MEKEELEMPIENIEKIEQQKAYEEEERKRSQIEKIDANLYSRQIA